MQRSGKHRLSCLIDALESRQLFAAGALDRSYSDDGKQDDSRSRAGSFGAELMRALAEQLNGEITTVDGMRRTTCLVMAPDSLGMRKAS